MSNALKWDLNTHVVQSGDTVATIALRYQVRVTDVIAWNQLQNADLIYAGQRLRIAPPPGWSPQPTRAEPPPSTAVAVVNNSPKRWFWPAQGDLVTITNAHDVKKGINISSSVGDPIFAAAAGKVVYSGSGLKGYGNLIIIKHNEQYLSAYGYNKSLLVSEGERVSAGQRIANMGVGPGRKPMLHFEIRRDGKPVDPLQYLKPR